MNLAGRVAKLESHRRRAGAGPCKACGSKPPKIAERSQKLCWLTADLVEAGEVDPFNCPRCKRTDARIDPAKEYAREMTEFLHSKYM